MRKLVSCLCFVAFLAVSCHKPADEGRGAVIRGKLVRQNCGYPVVRILDSNYFHLGQASWSPQYEEGTYQHVFLVDNPCSVSWNELDAGEEFRFRIVSNRECGFVCSILVLDNPDVKHQIEVVRP